MNGPYPLQDIFISVVEVDWLWQSLCPGLACVRNGLDPWGALTGTKHGATAGCAFERVSVCPRGQHVHSNGKSCLASYGRHAYPKPVH